MSEYLENELREEWSLKIIRVENGYILEKGDGTKIVIEEGEDPLTMHEDLLWAIQEYFAFVGSKHDPERIIVQRSMKDD